MDALRSHCEAIMSQTENGESSPRQFSQTPAGWAKRWGIEFEAARKFLGDWHKMARDCQAAYEDERADHHNEQRVNLFWANVTTQSALMYSRVPTVVVDREFSDHKDDPARIAGPIILQRLLNGDIKKPNDSFCRALENSLRDFRVVGYGFARVRYEVEFGDKEFEVKPGVKRRTKVKSRENVVTDYIYWEDQLHSPCRTFDLMTWWAFRTPMTREQVAARWGDKVAAKIPYDATVSDSNAKTTEDPGGASPWQRAWVWEIWDKTDKAVYWYVEGYAETLERKNDPYGLEGFFPFPEPMMANLSTSKFRAKPDYIMAQDLYVEVNRLQTRIMLLERALKVAGIYDQEAGTMLETLVNEEAENKLIPVTGWGKFQDKGGMDAVIQFLPVREIAETLVNLRAQQRETQQLLYEVTGQSDLTRGAAIKGGASATEAAGKIRYGSVRIQDISDRFAKFATGLQQLRAELITKLFDDATILRRANAQFLSEDPTAVMASMKVLREDFPNYRILIRSETMAAQDFAALKQDRIELLQAASGVMAATAPLVQMAGPMASVVGLTLLKYAVAGMRGTAEIEGQLDKMLDMATKLATQQMQNPQAAQQDPKAQAQQIKAMSDQQKAQADKEKLAMQHEFKMAEMEGEAILTERQQNIQRIQNVQETREVEAIKTAAARAKPKGEK